MVAEEKNYEFRKRLDAVHPRNIFDHGIQPTEGDFIIADGVEISYPTNVTEAVAETARDFADYLLMAFGISARLRPDGNSGIVLKIDETVEGKDAYQMNVTADGVGLSGNTPAAVRCAGVYLEDLLTAKRAPYLSAGKVTRAKLVSPRIVHSGWGMELFPDSHLTAILHAGFDAIAIFCCGYNRTNIGNLDFNDVIRRAAKYGIEVYLYSYLDGFKHPDDPDAEEHFDRVYGELFRAYPDAAGVMLVGESAEFPSKDPATTGKKFRDGVQDGIRDARPAPGWWPCYDYPAWFAKVRDAVRKVNPRAKIIFNTYNWGWAPVEMREKFISKLPEGVTLQVTYDIFSKRQIYGQNFSVCDYSITAEKPGYYFSSECELAAKYHLPLLATANTAGMTWDFGDVPYIPVPYRWIARFKELDRFRRECGLDAFYDCHHYGWYPSVMTELGKAYFSSPQSDLETKLEKLARHYAGAEGAESLLRAWKKWSDAFDTLPCANEDQYGPLRVGASYPLIFRPNITRTMASKELSFPTIPGAHFGGRIVKTYYQPYENIDQPPAALRYPAELRGLENFLQVWSEGIKCYTDALDVAPEFGKNYLRRELNLGKFILCSARTCYHVKKMWLLDRDLENIRTAAEGLEIIRQVEAIIAAEKVNVDECEPLVKWDSRLGWEPSMEYVCDVAHLAWKRRQLAMTEQEINDYKISLNQSTF